MLIRQECLRALREAFRNPPDDEWEEQAMRWRPAGSPEPEIPRGDRHRNVIHPRSENGEGYTRGGVLCPGNDFWQLDAMRWAPDMPVPPEIPDLATALRNLQDYLAAVHHERDGKETEETCPAADHAG